MTDEEWEAFESKRLQQWCEEDYVVDDSEFEESLHKERKWLGDSVNINKRDVIFGRSLAVYEILDRDHLFNGEEHQGAIGVDFCDVGGGCRKRSYRGPRKRRKKRLKVKGGYIFLKGKNTWVAKNDQGLLTRKRYSPRKRRKKILEWLIWDRSHSYMLPSLKYKGLFFEGERLDGLVDRSFLRFNRSINPDKTTGACERGVTDKLKISRTLRPKKFVFVQRIRGIVWTVDSFCDVMMGYATSMVKMGLVVSGEISFIFWLSVVKDKIVECLVCKILFSLLAMGMDLGRMMFGRDWIFGVAWCMVKIVLVVCDDGDVAKIETLSLLKCETG
jgi:hypothetical protein